MKSLILVFKGRLNLILHFQVLAQAVHMGRHTAAAQGRLSGRQVEVADPTAPTV